jgi:hypothetical protein
VTWALTINGDAHELQADSLRITYHASDRTTCDFDVAAIDPLYRPPLDAEVIIERDGVRLFGGLINRPTERGLGGGARPYLLTQCSAVDWAAYTDRRIIVDGGFPAGTTLGAAITALGPWLTPYGVTVDPAQVTGPTLPEILFPLNTVRDALNAVVSVTPESGEPFVWEIDAFKVLRAFQPSTRPAPFDILTNAPAQVVGDITVEPSKEGYANRVYVIATPVDVVGHEETFTGDGTTATFPLGCTLTAHRAVVYVDGVYETLSTAGIGFDLAAFWLYYPATNTIRRVVQVSNVAIDNPPAAGTHISITFDGTCRGSAMAEDPSAYTDPWEKAITVDAAEVPATATLQAMADALLAESLLIPVTVTYRTPTPGLQVGMSQQVTVPARAIDIVGLITEIGLFDAGNRLWWDVTVLAGAQSNLNRGYRTTVRNWSGDTSGGTGVSVGDGGPSSSGPAPPDTSVQFNAAGVFGGKPTFTFRQAQNSVVAGDLSSITATSFESCQVFGVDCHIAD